ncbi:hypothetical protein LCGC14_0276030 [marine sediment metagenome]|uniref:Uncharacterized protein n=1 Tax=marine sediment metagenome TaxID=412755 RepID=A0A0F9WIL9_9ZZZZ
MGTELTEEQKIHYLTVALGDRCPFCGCTDIESIYDGPITTQDWEVIMDIRCPDCKAKWRDIYTLSDVEDIEEEDSHDNA